MSKVVLDANVLYSNTLRNLFLWLSWNNLVEVFWSEEIWTEVFRNYSKDQKRNEDFKNHIASSVLVKFESSMKNLKSGYTLVGLPDKDRDSFLFTTKPEINRNKKKKDPLHKISFCFLKITYGRLDTCDLVQMCTAVFLLGAGLLRAS